MKKLITIIVGIVGLALLVLGVIYVKPQEKLELEGWKAFTNRAGWSIKYSPDWQPSSCTNCHDLTDPNVFVSFFPPKPLINKGWVMLSPLRDMPSDMNIDQWFKELKQFPLSQHTKEEKTFLSGLPAFRIVYQTLNNEEGETIYVVHNSKTFEISFGGGKSNTTLKDHQNYPIYLKMLSSLKFLE